MLHNSIIVQIRETTVGFPNATILATSVLDAGGITPGAATRVL